MKKGENKIEILEKVATELLSLMGTKVVVKVSEDKENEAFVVDIDAGDETGLLIGKKGETLTSLQTMLGVVLKQKTGEWVRVVVNVGDYRQKEEEYLKGLAESSAARALETGVEQNLYNLKPWQRRIVHMVLSENGKVVTESMGEGEERYLVVKPK